MRARGPTPNARQRGPGTRLAPRAATEAAAPGADGAAAAVAAPAASSTALRAARAPEPARTAAAVARRRPVAVLTGDAPTPSPCRARLRAPPRALAQGLVAAARPLYQALTTTATASHFNRRPWPKPVASPRFPPKVREISPYRRRRLRSGTKASSRHCLPRRRAGTLIRLASCPPR